MRIGVTLPQFGPLAHEAGDVARFARQAEELGAASLWAGDRILAPVDPVTRYPGTTPDGPAYPAEFRAVLDPLTLLTVAATATERVRLGTSTLNATWYPPVTLARTLTSIDQVSGGRLIAGFGIGWSPDEYRAVGVPWQHRGDRLDETLDVLRAVWTTSPAEHTGPAFTLPASYFDLRPVQRPHPPVYLAGLREAGLRRVGRRAEGWLPVRLPIGLLRTQLAVVRGAAEQAGRDPGTLAAALRVNLAADSSLTEVADYLAEVEETFGIDEAFVDPMYVARTVDEALDVLAQLLSLST